MEIISEKKDKIEELEQKMQLTQEQLQYVK